MVPGNIVFRSYKVDKSTNGEELTFNLMVYEFAAAALMLPAFVLIKNSPPSPPSAFANTDVPVPFKQAMRGLFSNKGFVLAFLANSIYFGCLKGFGVVIPYLLLPYGFESG